MLIVIIIPVEHVHLAVVGIVVVAECEIARFWFSSKGACIWSTVMVAVGVSPMIWIVAGVMATRIPWFIVVIIMCQHVQSAFGEIISVFPSLVIVLIPRTVVWAGSFAIRIIIGVSLSVIAGVLSAVACV